MYLSFYSRKGPTVCRLLRDGWRDIYLERGLLFSYLLPGSSWCQRLHPRAGRIVRDVSDPLIGCVSLARLLILCTLSKSDHVVITWSPSGYTPVEPDCHDALSSPCLLITTWQLVKARRVTRNELKIHVIYYITEVWYTIKEHEPFITFVEVLTQYDETFIYLGLIPKIRWNR